ncbi:MAG: NAD(P)/FAD-dependent oxidoreductase [Methanosarcinaceae archaeon]|nr:NAD(P)/FAD-dependent oxidoreductase [Methanosarcinaceae archaeon]
MKNNLPEKNAILQRDREKYLIAPSTPGGFVDPETLRKIANVAEKYGASTLKMTSAQKMAIIGLKEKDLDAAWDELQMEPGMVLGTCVKGVKFCPGTTFCKKGQQDAVSLGMKLNDKYVGMKLPFFMKMGVSGCPSCCAESPIKDIGIIGTSKGFTLMVGGSAGLKPRLADVVAKNLSEDEILEIVDRIVTFYKENGEPKMRIGKLIDRMGIEEFKKEVGLWEI